MSRLPIAAPLLFASLTLSACSESDTQCAAPGPQCESAEDESATPCAELEQGCREVSVSQCGQTYLSYCRAPACPPSNPIGTPCELDDQVCAYGYLGDDCGGITALCVAETWTEREHTDPGPNCPGNSVNR